MNIIEEWVDITGFTTLKLPAQSHYFSTITNSEELVEALQKNKQLRVPILILGGGSNLIILTPKLEYHVLHLNIKGFEIKQETNDFTIIKIGAGERWDNIVDRTVQMNLSGIEAMSLIPGTCGATPVQNVGAYGQEIKDTLIELEAYDRHLQKFVNLQNVDCEFSYRKSIFNQEYKNRYIITSITLKLYKNIAAIPNYKDVITFFESSGNKAPTLHEIRQAIISIRTRKLPDPHDIPNVGSFFKNPIVTIDNFKSIEKKFSDIPHFILEDSSVKLYAGWLIERAGFKGFHHKGFEVYEKNALVITNVGNGSIDSLIELINIIRSKIRKLFQIELEVEPIMIK